MVAAIQILRSIVRGNRPTGRQYGEPYVNFAENQFGVHDASNVPRDLIGVPIFSTGQNYVVGNAVVYQGLLYIANQAVTAGAWNPAQWSQVQVAANLALGGILTFVSATSLKFAPYAGSYIRLNGVFRAIPTAGIAGLGNTGVFVNGTAGQNLVANTVYWVFCFDNGGVLTADFRTAATHAQSATAGNEGTEILTGNDTRSLIGMCRTTAASQFSASGKQQFVLSWFNRKQIFSTLTDTLTDRLVMTGVTPTEATPPGRIEFLCWAGAAKAWCYGPIGGNASDLIMSDVRFDGSAALGGATGAVLAAAAYTFNPGVPNIQNLSEGYHYASLWLHCFTASTSAYIYGATWSYPLVINAEVLG